MNKPNICTRCSEPYPIDNLTEFDGQLLCPACLEAETVVCANCGNRVWLDSNAGSRDLPLCHDCYDDYYTSCIECGRIIRRDDACHDADDDPYCCQCHGQCDDDEVIHEYYYKPKPIFFGESDRYFGVELEVDEAGESDSNAAAVLKLANEGGIGHVYAKHDGSIDDGFELVTHPMTMDYHIHEMPWEMCLDKLKDMGYLSHQAGTCGLHIHMNRSSLGATEEEQEATIARILYFFEKHWRSFSNSPDAPTVSWNAGRCGTVTRIARRTSSITRRRPTTANGTSA